MSPANFGRYRHRVKIQQSTPSTDAAGLTIDVWSTLTNWYCSIDPASGVEQENAEQFESSVSHILEGWAIRNFTVKSNMRVLYGARAFNIESALNVNEHNELLRLQCSEVISG